MIIERLDLTAFGRFTNTSLDLSAAPHRLHVIYGPNESGKSTALRAITSLLFGMPHRTDDNYLHPNTKMRVGGRLLGPDGEVLECVRRRGQRKTLRDADDKDPVDQQRLEAMLGGITQQAFLTRFGLAHDELVRGGDEILAGDGELGQILFAAGAGIGRLRQLQQQLEEQGGELFKAAGKKDRINQAVRELDELRRQRKAAQLPPDDFTARRRELAEARAQADRLNETLQQDSAEVQRLRALAQALPLVPQWRSATEQLAELKSVPLLDDEFSHQRQQAQQDYRAAEKEQEKLNSRLEKLKQQRRLLGDDAVVLTHQQEIEALFQELSAREKAKREYAELNREQYEADQNMIELLRELQIEIAAGDPHDSAELIDDHVERLRLNDSVRSRIDELAGQYAKLVQQRDDAEEEVETLSGKLDDVKAELEVSPRGGDPELLGEVIDAIGSPTALTETLVEQNDARDQLKQRCQELCRRLDGFTGTFSEAAELRLPDTTKVDQVADQLGKAEQVHGSAVSAVEQLRRDCTEASERLQAQQSSEPLPTDDQLADARQHRDRLVDRCSGAEPHASDSRDRHQTLAEEMDRVREAIRSADQIVDTMRRHHEQVHARAAERAALDQLEQHRAEAEAEAEAAKQQLQDAQSRWDQLWESLGIEAGTPQRMQRLQNDHEQLVNDHQRWQTACTRCDATEKKIHSAVNRLRAALKSSTRGAAGSRSPEIAEENERSTADKSSGTAEIAHGFSGEDPSRDLVTLYDQAVALRRQWQQRQQTVDELHRRKSQLTEEFQQASAQLKGRRKALQRWTEAWKQAVESFAHCGDVTPAEAKPMMRRVDELCGEKQQRDARNRKIRSIVEDHQAFDERVRRLFAAMGDDQLVGSDADRAVRELYQRLGEERSAKQRRESLDQQCKELEDQLRETDQQQSQSAAALAQLCEEAGCQRPEELPELERRSRLRRDCATNVQQLEARLRDISGGRPLDEFVAQASGQQPGAIDVEIEQKETAIEQTRQQALEAERQVGKLTQALEQMNGSDRASGLQQSIQLKLGEISRDAEQFARLKVAATILQRAIEHYRRENQGPILVEAERLFRSLTCGEYRQLKVDYDSKGQPALFGVRATEEEHQARAPQRGDASDAAATEVPAQLMSAGTADALYLAFRLASLRHQFRHGSPIPLVVDDCLIQLDDARAAAALRALSELSETTQVILMTHHRHLLELAAEHLGPGRYHIHHLDAAVAVGPVR